MNEYAIVKWIHIVSSTILFGTGLGTALHMWLTHHSGDVQAIATTARNVVRVDWMFTATSGIVQPITGIILMRLLGFDPAAPWLLASYALYVFAFCCWASVVWLQMRVRDIAQTAASQGTALPARYYQYMRWWFWLGWPAFFSLLAVFYLMTAKPG